MTRSKKQTAQTIILFTLAGILLFFLSLLFFYKEAFLSWPEGFWIFIGSLAGTLLITSVILSFMINFQKQKSGEYEKCKFPLFLLILIAIDLMILTSAFLLNGIHGSLNFKYSPVILPTLCLVLLSFVLRCVIFWISRSRYKYESVAGFPAIYAYLVVTLICIPLIFSNPGGLKDVFTLRFFHF